MFDTGVRLPEPEMNHFLDASRYSYRHIWGGHFHNRGLRKIKQVKRFAAMSSTALHIVSNLAQNLMAVLLIGAVMP